MLAVPKARGLKPILQVALLDPLGERGQEGGDPEDWNTPLTPDEVNVTLPPGADLDPEAVSLTVTVQVEA